MAVVTFGRFTLSSAHGEALGAVVIAPEYILLQRPSSSAVHDLSYLAVWSGARVASVRSELAMLGQTGRATVDGRTPELAAILRAIEPTATAVFCYSGDCSRTFARRRLKAALETAASPRAAAAPKARPQRET